MRFMCDCEGVQERVKVVVFQSKKKVASENR